MIKSTEEVMNKRLVKTVFSKQEKKLQNNAEQIVEALKKLYTESERAVPEYGDFRVVKTNFKNSDKNLGIKDITISIHPSVLGKERPKERELRIKANSSDNLSNYSVVLEYGSKYDILKLLEDEQTCKNIEEFIQKASDKFSDIG